MLINEFRFYFRQPITWLGFIILIIFAYLLCKKPINVNIETIKFLNLKHIALMMLSLPFSVAFITPIAFLRDSKNHMTELIQATPSHHIHRMLSRWFAISSLLAITFLLAFAVQVIMIGYQLGEISQLIESSLINYVLILIPNLFLLTSLALWLSTRFDKSFILYSVFISLWFTYVMLSMFNGSPILNGSYTLSQTVYGYFQWLDPYAITTISEQIESPLQWLNNIQAIYNRLFYLLVSFTFVYFALKTRPKKIYQSSIKQKMTPDTPNTFISVNYKATKTQITNNKQLFQLYLFNLKLIFKHELTLILLFGWCGVMISETMAGIDYAEPLAVVIPTSLDALNRVVWDTLPIIGSILLAFWAWQICWRDKINNMSELVGVSSTNSTTLLLSQMLTVITLVFMLLILTALSVNIAHTLSIKAFQFSNYITTLIIAGVPLILLAVCFVAINHVIKSSFIAAFIMIVILCIKHTSILSTLGLHHPLLKFVNPTIMKPDDLWQFSASFSSYWRYCLFWFLNIICLSIFSVIKSHRGTGNNIAVQQVNRQLMVGLKLTLLVTPCISFLFFHSYIYQEKPSKNEYLEWQVNYEKNYKQWLKKPQPSIQHIDANIDFYPINEMAKMKFNIRLNNQHNEAIKQLLIGLPFNNNEVNLKLQNGKLAFHDQKLKQFIFNLITPLQPNQTLTLEVELDYFQPKLWFALGEQILKPEFSYLQGRAFLPYIGFQQKLTIRNKQTREQFGLPSLNIKPPSKLFTKNKKHNSKYSWFSLNSTISTIKGYQAITQGKLHQQWTQGNRDYFVFKTFSAVHGMPAWLTVPYQKLTTQVNNSNGDNIQLAVYSPENNDATQLNLAAMHNTINWFEKNIANYHGAHLSLVATPNIGFSGFALPQILLINHKLGFRSMPSSNAKFNQIYRRAVHETAHQWFGHNIGNGVLKDRAFLIESMAKYIELVLIEDYYGKDAMLSLVNYEKQRYKNYIRKNVRKIPAIVDASNHTDQYSRATIVFSKLRKVLGDKVITKALRELWQQHAYPKTPATSMDFYRLLLRHSSEHKQDLIKELLLGQNIKSLLN